MGISAQNLFVHKPMEIIFLFIIKFIIIHYWDSLLNFPVCVWNPNRAVIIVNSTHRFYLLCFVVVFFFLLGVWNLKISEAPSNHSVAPQKSHKIIYSQSYSARKNHQVYDIFPAARPSQTAPFIQSCHPEVSLSNLAESSYHYSKIAIFVINPCWSCVPAGEQLLQFFPFYILWPLNC